MPYLNPDDRVFVSSIPYFFSRPKKGDIVLFENNGKMLVKRIDEILNNRFRLEGDNKRDSLKVGWIERKDIKGKFVCKIINNK